MRRYLILLALLMSTHLWAASAKITTNGTTCATTTNCLVVSLPQDKGGATITLSGTWTGTMQFESTGDGGTTWTATLVTPLGSTTAVTSTTSNGTWQVNVSGFTGLRVRSSASMTGTAVATITPSAASARFIVPNGGSSPGTIATTPNVLMGDNAGAAIASTILDDGNGVAIASATGGTQGTGTLNAVGLYVNGAAVDARVGQSNLSAFHTTQGPTNLVASPVNNHAYVVNYVIWQATSGSGGTCATAATITPAFTWTDPSNTAQTNSISAINVPATLAAGVTANGSFRIVTKSGTAIAYTLTWANGNCTTQPTAQAQIWAEAVN